jgi:sugar lactone lactonase YvrE
VGISLDSDGSIYVGDNGLGAIFRVTPSGTVSVLAGGSGNHGSQDGVGSAAQFAIPTGVATDGNGNVYVGDASAIRKIVIATGEVSTLAGNAFIDGSADGTGASARFNRPCGIEADHAGNVYVADCSNHTIRKVTPSGVVTTLAGTAGVAGYVDGDISAALFYAPADVALDDNGNLYVADQGNFLVRKITPAGVVSTVAGIKGLQGQAVGPLPASLGIPVGIHARTLSGGGVELLLTIEHGVVRILTD